MLRRTYVSYAFGCVEYFIEGINIDTGYFLSLATEAEGVLEKIGKEFGADADKAILLQASWNLQIATLVRTLVEQLSTKLTLLLIY